MQNRHSIRKCVTSFMMSGMLIAVLSGLSCSKQSENPNRISDAENQRRLQKMNSSYAGEQRADATRLEEIQQRINALIAEAVVLNDGDLTAAKRARLDEIDAESERLVAEAERIKEAHGL